ncbi:hypothetical protein OS965_40200 [Streptomyces sp. H27-G5]|uniref:hypothetical protein n=1 Tax=Streptomyces sp. H27-G5 TaxID=2996698 RepID=UPI00226F968D|nr:hypothetical protein [Streptomyces sp. H27-G5]MCY0924256.1 hypothetical protein [Streptomyces sp. H27-G5]
MPFRIHQELFDSGREMSGTVVRVYQYGGLLKLRNSDDEWLAAQDRCEPVGRAPAPIERAESKKPEPLRIPPGTIPHPNCAPTDLQVGDFVVVDGQARRIDNMVGRVGTGRRTLFLDGGLVRPAKAVQNVYRAYP